MSAILTTTINAEHAKHAEKRIHHRGTEDTEESVDAAGLRSRPGCQVERSEW